MIKNNVDKQYLNYLKYILDNGVRKLDRTGTGTISIFDYSMCFNMKEGFPLLTSKKVFLKGVIHELIWFLRGDTNIRYLVENGVNIWNGDAYKNYLKNIMLSSSGEWCAVEEFSDGGYRPRPYTQEEFIELVKTDDDFAKKWGELGPVYGKQWRAWGGYNKKPSGWHHGQVTSYKTESNNDQITELIDRLKNDPDSRRLMVMAWNVEELPKMALPPCHFGFQCYTSELSYQQRIKWWCDNLGKHISYADDLDERKLDELKVPKRKLDLKWFQRSVDSPLGLPFNIASYAILLHLLSKEVNMIPGDLIFSGGDCHIYTNQVDGVEEQLDRKTYKLPKIKLNNKSIFDLKYEDIEIIGYESSTTIHFPLSN
jgi:thymidylate synthase